MHLAGYTELCELGSGAHGRVVLAREDVSGRVVAIKYLARTQLIDPKSQMLFRKEAAVLTRVVSPHVAQLHQYVERPDGAAIIMEAVGGHTLRRVLDEHGTQPPETALAILKGSLLGLASAHSVGVVHRDYKPANVIVQPNRQSKLIDFGIAVLAGRGDFSGTPRYMAPEQWDGLPASPATDIYAATCVFFECATSRPPYREADLDVLADEHRRAPVPLGEVLEPLRPLVARGMAKDPAQRFGNATEFVAALEALANTAYGPDWEKRGLAALGAVTAVMVTAFPLALLGSSVLTPATAIGSGTATVAGEVGGNTAGALAEGAVQLGHSTAENTAALGGQGLLAKAGGAKGVAGLSVGGAVVITAAMLLWPSGPEAGGVSRGSVHSYFTRPGVLLGLPSMPESDTPYMKFDLTVSPARARPGMKVQVTSKFSAKTPHGLRYTPDGTRQCFGEKHNRKDTNRGYRFEFGGDRAGNEDSTLKDGEAHLWLFGPTSSQSDGLPEKPGATLLTKEKTTNEAQPYILAECAYLSTWTNNYELMIPRKGGPAPGDYQIFLTSPPRLTSVSRSGDQISLDSTGARTEGSLPVLTILPQ